MKNKANCELVEQALSFLFSLLLQHFWHGQKERAKDFTSLTHVTHHLNSHSVNRRSKANKHH